MAFPTSVNGQITLVLEKMHDAGGIDAVMPIIGLLEAIDHRLSGAEPSAEVLSAAFRKAEAELQPILAKLESGRR